MALLFVYDGAAAIQEQTLRRPFPLRISEREREFRGLSSVFGAARKYGSGWIGQVILIGWKGSATLMVKLNYTPNKNSSFFLLQVPVNLISFRLKSLKKNQIKNWFEINHHTSFLFNVDLILVVHSFEIWK